MEVFTSEDTVVMDSKESVERMESGRLYQPNDEAIIVEQLKCVDRMRKFNLTLSSQEEERKQLMKEMFAEIGKDCYIEPPVHSNFGCKHVHFGDYVYANFNLTLVDDAHIYVGDCVLFAPNVTIASASHPIDPFLRKQGLQYAIDVHIGNNVWIGAGAVIMPGVTIGDNSVIGAGSIVTKDIPANVVAFGNPCKVIREISDYDKEYYFKDRKVDL